MSAAEIEVPYSFLNVKYAKSFGKHNNGVLVGNWFEDRVLAEEKNQAERSGTAVKTIKVCDTCCFGDKIRHRWPNHGKARADLIGAHRVAALFRETYRSRSSMRECLSPGDASGMGQNMTSKYTLDYGLQDPSRHLDALKSYGNLTHFGLRDWQTCMRNATDGRCCYSLMKENFRCHPFAALQTQHHSTPAKWSTKLHKTNLTNKNLVLRNDKSLHISNDSNIEVQNK